MNTAKMKDTAPILCGTDFSENARHAANVATALAGRLGVATRLVHASTIPAFPAIHGDLQREVLRLAVEANKAWTMEELSAAAIAQVERAAQQKKTQAAIVELRKTVRLIGLFF